MKYETDKFDNGLIWDYSTLLSPLKYKKITLMEIGVAVGGSIDYWADYLKHPDSKIVGVDCRLPKVDLIDINLTAAGKKVKLSLFSTERAFPKNVVIYECNQNDSQSLRAIAEKHGPFDIIIDDASHHKAETENCFNVLFDHVNLGGYYVIEDWNVGYRYSESHYQGMVEVITNIVKHVPQLGIEEMNIILKQKKAVAFFRKGQFCT